MICKYFLPFCQFSHSYVHGILWCTKIFHFDEVQFVFLLLLVPLMSYPRNPCQMQLSWNFSIMFSFKSFVVIAVKFRSLIHFELIYVPCNFILMYVDIQFSQHHVLKSLFFLFEWYWPSFWKLFELTWASLFLISLFFHWFICLPGFPFHVVLITVALQWYLIFRRVTPSTLLFFKFVLAISCLLRFHMNFRMNFSITT